jgi:flagellar protein FliS
MTSSTQVGTYQAVQATTADSAQLTLMLFDGAVRFLTRAQIRLAAGDVGQFAQAVARAQAIIGELRNSLDRERGGELADNLDRLYDFMLRHLSQGLLTRSARHVEQVLRPLQTVREGFEVVFEGQRR